MSTVGSPNPGGAAGTPSGSAAPLSANAQPLTASTGPLQAQQKTADGIAKGVFQPHESAAGAFGVGEGASAKQASNKNHGVVVLTTAVAAANSSIVHALETIDKDRLSQPQEKRRVIIVGGHSTAGKTTIINAIMKLDPNQSELGIDITPPRSIYEYLETNHTMFGVSKEDWKHLHDVLIPRDENYHIHDAVDDGQFLFHKGISENDKKRAKDTAAKLRDPCKKFIGTLPHSSVLVMDKAHELATSGKNVVMDTVNIDKLANHALENQGQITKVLVYCRLTALSSRLMQRTREALDSGHPENVRAGTFPLHQYLEVFGPRKKEDKDADVIDTVSRETVEQVIDAQFDAGIQDLKRRNPQEYARKIGDGTIAKEKESEKAKLLAAFGFTPSDPMHKTIQLTPRLPWTIRVDTSDYSSTDEIAKGILKYHS
jgi:energy-coupling factor transporter ATP-binding protein EcfA2